MKAQLNHERMNTDQNKAAEQWRAVRGYAEYTRPFLPIVVPATHTELTVECDKGTKEDWSSPSKPKNNGDDQAKQSNTSRLCSAEQV